MTIDYQFHGISMKHWQYDMDHQRAQFGIIPITRFKSGGSPAGQRFSSITLRLQSGSRISKFQNFKAQALISFFQSHVTSHHITWFSSDVSCNSHTKFNIVSYRPSNMFNEDEDLERSYITSHIPKRNWLSYRAIALSLQEASKKPALINLDSDEDEVVEARFQRELDHVLQASKAESSSAPTSTYPTTIGNSQIVDQAQGQSAVSSFLSERAQLEKERRERQKRLRPQASSSSVPAPDDDSDLEEPPAKRHQVSYSNTSFKRSDISHDSSSKNSHELPTIEQVFWNGELRQTTTQHAEPRKDGQATFRLTDVLGKVKNFTLILTLPASFNLTIERKRNSNLLSYHRTHWIGHGFTNFSIVLFL